MLEAIILRARKGVEGVRTASRKGKRAMPKTINDLPTVTFPAEDYPRDMPLYLAEVAERVGPIFRREWEPGRYVVYMVGPEANKCVLLTHRACFSHDLGWTPIIGEFLGKGLLNTDDPLHAVHRKMMNPAFTVAYMEHYLPIMERVIRERTRDWVARGVVDVYQEARKITFDVAAETLVGFRAGPEVDQLRQLFSAILQGDFEDEDETPEQFWQRMLLVGGQLSQRLREMIDARRHAPPGTEYNDILTTMVHARDDEGHTLTDEQLLGHVNILLVAGHETSTALSAWLLQELATHPDYLARVRAELAEIVPDPEQPLTMEQIKALRVLGNAVTEAGRLHAPAGNVPRGVVRDFEFHDYVIPAGTRLVYSIAASHYLPWVFAEPRRFDPDRFAPPREEDRRTPYGLVTFGGGPRICIGINFAQVEIKALAAHVLRRFDIAPAEGGAVEMHYYGPTGTIPGGVPMRVTSRA
jgi:cytochrome P450